MLRGKTDAGVWEERVRIPATKADEGSGAVVALFGRETVEDVEMLLAGGLAPSAADARIESLGLSYRIATRLTSWVAIDSQPSVDPRDPMRRVTMPQSLPYGTSVESFGLRSGQPGFGARAVGAAATTLGISRSAPAPAAARPMSPPQGRARMAKESEAAKGRADEADSFGGRSGGSAPPPAQAPKKPSFIERVRGAFTGKSERAPAWYASIALVGAGEIVLEIAVFEGQTLAWTVAPEVEASIDGKTVRLVVDASRTTRDGTYEGGTTVRLVLQVPPDFDASKLGELTMNGLALTVVRPHLSGRGA